MEPINLLPWRQMHRRRCARRQLLLCGVQLLLVPAIFAVLASRSRRRRQALESALQGRQRRIAKDEGQRQRLLAEVAQRQVLARRQRQLAAVNLRYLNLLRQLPTLLPPQLWLTHVAQRGGRLYIRGCSDGYPPIVMLQRRLADHPLLPGLRWRELRRQAQGNWQFALESVWPAGEE